jgi:hypothetical protein
MEKKNTGTRRECSRKTKDWKTTGNGQKGVFGTQEMNRACLQVIKNH